MHWRIGIVGCPPRQNYVNVMLHVNVAPNVLVYEYVRFLNQLGGT